MSLTVPNDGSVSWKAGPIHVKYKNHFRYNRSSQLYTHLLQLRKESILKRIAPVCRRCEVKANCVMPLFFLHLCS